MIKITQEVRSIPENFTGVVEFSGAKFWYVRDKRHRDGGLPAVEYSNGSKEWWVNGQRHRDGGLPAMDYEDGTKFWYVKDNRHRDAGLPAIERSDGTKEWWVEGKQVDPYEGKLVDIDGKKYILQAL